MRKFTDTRRSTQRASWWVCAASTLGLGALSGVLHPAPASAGFFGMELSAPEVADILYARYRVARVMSVITVGNVYQADAIDRRGYRVRFIVDGDNGAVLDSFMIGRSAYEAPVPIPPGLVPPPAARLAPSPMLRSVPPEPKNLPRSRQATTPDPRSITDDPGKARPDPGAKPSPSLRAVPSPSRQEPEPPTAARPSAPAQEPQSPKPTVTVPSQPDASPRSQPAEARQANPVSRMPEPLIDPKTGRAAGSVPVTPLDETRPAGGTPKPITVVPPAPLE